MQEQIIVSASMVAEITRPQYGSEEVQIEVWVIDAAPAIPAELHGARVIVPCGGINQRSEILSATATADVYGSRGLVGVVDSLTPEGAALANALWRAGMSGHFTYSARFPERHRSFALVSQSYMDRFGEALSASGGMSRYAGGRGVRAAEPARPVAPRATTKAEDWWVW